MHYLFSSFFFCLPLCVGMSTASLIMCLFISTYFCFSAQMFASLCISKPVCLFGCYPAPVIIFAKCLYSHCKS